MTERPFTIITGASRGIGRACALHLARCGHDIGFTYRENAAAARETEEALRGLGAACTSLRWDQAQADGAERAIAALMKGRARLDHAILNAGMISHAPLDSLSPDDWDCVMAVNARGTAFALQHVARRMRDGGSIVAISSMATRYPSAGEAAYAASKAAVEQIFRVASRELGPRGIAVNVIAPGPTRSDMTAFVPPEVLGMVAGITAMGRIAEPEDIAGAVAALLLAKPVWMTGQVVMADGGLT